jgi:hypothetical protein
MEGSAPYGRFPRPIVANSSICQTNVLLTRFLSPVGVAEVIDFMPLGGDAECSTIIRQVNITRGEMELRFECSPAFHYASDSFEVDSEKGLLFRSKDSGLLLVESDASVSANLEETRNRG